MPTARIAIVTGAAQGVGLVTATTLGRQGFHVVLTDVQTLDHQVADLVAAGIKAQVGSRPRWMSRTRGAVPIRTMTS
jgi:NAD(P)-dependent dehydrogenase (short-subunit alcohol dehydrogenase family)